MSKKSERDCAHCADNPMMKQQLHRRLAELERVAEARVRAQPADDDEDSSIEMVKQYLRARGIEQSPLESLAETFARALGITCRELRERLSA
jgi:hypothetical protein